LEKRPTWLKIVTYAASFLFPFFGLAYGALERCREEPEANRRGKICLILGIAGLVVACGAATAWLALGLKAGFDFLIPQ
jgi:hypothetical protein